MLAIIFFSYCSSYLAQPFRHLMLSCTVDV